MQLECAAQPGGTPLHIHQPIALAGRGKLESPPLSLICSSRRPFPTCISTRACVHAEWRAALLTASLKIRYNWRRKSELDASGTQNIQRETPHPGGEVTQVVVLRVDGPDDIA